jgi:phosphomannomutase
MAQFATGIGKTPQVIASAFVGNGKRFNREALDVLESELLTDTVGLIRINLRYSGTEPLFRAMLESDDRLLEEALISMATRVCRQAQALSGIEDGMLEVLNCTRGGVKVITNK